jgi:F-box protein 21
MHYRFYSEAILGCLHRTLAIEEWSRLRNRQSVTLERALSAFDMFVLHERYGDFDEVCLRSGMKGL